MSKIAISGASLGSATFTIESPATSTNRTLTLPDSSGTVVVTGGAQTIEFAAGTVSAPSITTTGDTNTGIFFPAADTIAFTEGGAEAMRIDANSNVQIATTSNSLLWFNLTTTGNRFRIEQNGAPAANAYVTQGLVRNSNEAESAILGFAKSRGTTAGSATIVNNNDNLGVITFQGADGTNYVEGARITAIVNGTPGANDMPGALLFSTTADGDSAVTERARITSGGFFKAKGNETNYIGSTSDYHEFINGTGDSVVIWARHNAASPYGYFVDFNSDPNNATNYVFAANSGGNLVYRIFSNGTVTARSDAKWKKNIETARNGYAEDLARLRVVKYNWYNHEDGTPKELGLIAQEVEEVFPGLVQADEEIKNEVRTREIPAVLDNEGNEIESARIEEYTENVGTGEYTKSIKFSVFVPMLIKVCQEQQQRIETLEANNAALEARITAIENGA